ARWAIADTLPVDTALACTADSVAAPTVAGATLQVGTDPRTRRQAAGADALAATAALAAWAAPATAPAVAAVRLQVYPRAPAGGLPGGTGEGALPAHAALAAPALPA